MKVTVYYDYICPYCFLGTKRVERLTQEFEMTVEWKGIEIHPEIPPQGVKRTRTFKFQQVSENIKEMSQEDNLEINLPGTVANSRLSLEASEFAKSKDRFREFHNSVYEAYFQKGENIGNIDVILDIGEKNGLEINELEECLKKRTMLKKIADNGKAAEIDQVLGVPTFLFGKFGVHGVQSLDGFRKIINRVIERSLHHL
ncbi:MAG TPA: DsbA family protein [Thermodesulfobacteriota bacterium]|jgi:predicted DsbA family dithiol-disulfide isomerase